ncbi:MAG: 30S ribosomal protein S5 [Candidatus Micrarchaeota archaeon]|nr:30S ribosomal protein S5 [Candidatus Micrarchaeota archaeon]
MSLFRGGFYRRRREEEEKPAFNIAEWTPRTKLGEQVKAGQITSIEQIFAMGKPIKEVEIVDALLPGLEAKNIETASVQRMTKDARKMKYRTTVIVGDRKGHVGLGVGKTVEVRPAFDEAVKDAKMHIISLTLGCGSWECNCGTAHSLPITLRAKVGTAEIILKPAPRGVGVVAGVNARAVLEIAGIKDVWTFARGRTRDKYNMALATFWALKSLSEMKNVEKLKT